MQQKGKQYAKSSEKGEKLPRHVASTCIIMTTCLNEEGEHRGGVGRPAWTSKGAPGLPNPSGHFPLCHRVVKVEKGKRLRRPKWHLAGKMVEHDNIPGAQRGLSRPEISYWEEFQSHNRTFRVGQTLCPDCWFFSLTIVYWENRYFKYGGEAQGQKWFGN